MTDTGAGFGHPSKIHFSCSKDNLNVANIQHAPLVGYLYLRSLAIQKIPSFISSPSSPLNSTSPRRALYTTSWRCCCCLPSSDFHTLIPFISWNFHATTDLFILSSPVLRSRTNHSKRLEFSHKETKKDKKESPFFHDWMKLQLRPKPSKEYSWKIRETNLFDICQRSESKSHI